MKSPTIAIAATVMFLSESEWVALAAFAVVCDGIVQLAGVFELFGSSDAPPEIRAGHVHRFAA
jgi:hypothetical protein